MKTKHATRPERRRARSVEDINRRRARSVEDINRNAQVHAHSSRLVKTVTKTKASEVTSRARSRGRSPRRTTPQPQTQQKTPNGSNVSNSRLSSGRVELIFRVYEGKAREKDRRAELMKSESQPCVFVDHDGSKQKNSRRKGGLVVSASKRTGLNATKPVPSPNLSPKRSKATRPGLFAGLNSEKLKPLSPKRSRAPREHTSMLKQHQESTTRRPRERSNSLPRSRTPKRDGTGRIAPASSRGKGERPREANLTSRYNTTESLPRGVTTKRK